jgi:hypothetical protein
MENPHPSEFECHVMFLVVDERLYRELCVVGLELSRSEEKWKGMGQ